MNFAYHYEALTGWSQTDGTVKFRIEKYLKDERTVYGPGSSAGSVQSDDPNKYPKSGQEGSYWFTYNGVS